MGGGRWEVGGGNWQMANGKIHEDAMMAVCPVLMLVPESEGQTDRYDGEEAWSIVSQHLK